MTNSRRTGVIWAAVSTAKQTTEDKHSLPLQVAEARAFFEREGIEVLDVLMVPGHSRRYKDFNELARKAAAKGVEAFVKLEQYWRAGAFDVLWVRGGDRFARTQSLHARITEEVIDSKAVIYSSEDGWIDKQNYRMWTAMSGFSAASNVDRLVEYARKVKDEKAALGLCINSRVWWSHKTIRNEFGKIQAIVPDEDKRLILEDAARLVIEGVGWHVLESELRARFGHTNNGKPFARHFFYHLFHNPHFYGNSARRWRSKYVPNGARWDMWIFDPNADAPEGTLIFYDTHEPALSPPLLDELKAEIRRRRSAIRGGSRPHRTKLFSGLMVCGHCLFAMTWLTNGSGRSYWRCALRAATKAYGKTCVGQHLREDDLIAWWSKWLALMLEHNTPFINPDGTLPDRRVDNVAALEKRIADVTGRARRLIEKQASADTAMSALYEEQIQSAADELKLLRARLQAEQRAASDTGRADMVAALDDVRAYGSLDELWRAPSHEINVLLHRLCGPRRLSCMDGEVADVIERV